MSRIQITNLTFSYDTSFDPIFENVSFQIDTDWKLGFIGRNGRGKTTFLNLLLGKYNYRGTISASVDFEYFPYPVEHPEDMTLSIIEEVNPLAESWQICKELNLLDADPEILYRPFSSLSNGERTKVLLAALFLKENAFLLIDEPTNHLDIRAREKVARYLNSKNGFILVSHDRAFLDECIDHVLSINKADIEIQKGTFSSWFANKEAQDKMELERNVQLKQDIRRLEEASRRTERWSDKIEGTKTGTRIAGLRPDRGHIGHQAAKMMKRSKSTQKRQQNAISEKEHLLKNIETADDLKTQSAAIPHKRTALYGRHLYRIQRYTRLPEYQFHSTSGRPHLPERKKRMRQDQPDQINPGGACPIYRQPASRKPGEAILHLPGHLLAKRKPH